MKGKAEKVLRKGKKDKGENKEKGKKGGGGDKGNIFIIIILGGRLTL